MVKEAEPKETDLVQLKIARLQTAKDKRAIIRRYSKNERLYVGERLFEKQIDYLLKNGVPRYKIHSWLKTTKGFMWFLETPLTTIKEIREVLSKFRLAPAFPVVIAAHMRTNIREREPQQLAKKLQELFAFGALYYPGRREKLKMFLLRHPHFITMPLPAFKATLAKSNPKTTEAIKRTIELAKNAGFSSEEALRAMQRFCRRGKPVVHVENLVRERVRKIHERKRKIRTTKAKSKRKPR